MASARTQPHPALELSSLWRSYRSAVTDPRLSEDCVFHLNPFVDVEWFTGRGERWQRGFWLSVDDSDVVHRVSNVTRMFETVQGQSVMVGVQVDTEDDFTVFVHIDPVPMEVV